MKKCGDHTAGDNSTGEHHSHEHSGGSCHELLSSLSEYVDGSLQAELCEEIERHLHECNKCKVVVNTLKKTVELYHDSADDCGMPDEVRQRLFMRLDLKDYLAKAD